MEEELTHEELVQIAILEALEDLNDKISKIELDGMIMLFIEIDILEN